MRFFLSLIQERKLTEPEAPPELTKQRLMSLRKAGKPIDIVVFPNTDHGMVAFTESVDGMRKYTRYAEGYFRLLADWSKGCFSPPYGKAEFSSLRMTPAVLCHKKPRVKPPGKSN